MGILSFLGDIFKPVVNLIEHIVPDGDKKVELKGKIVEAEKLIQNKVIELELKLLDAQKTVLVAEIQGESWLQRSWRPMTMLCFVFIVMYSTVAPLFGLKEMLVNERVYDIITIGLGGYVVGRSSVQFAKEWAKVKKENK